MRKTLALAFVLGISFGAAASDQTNKPSASQTVPGAPAGGAAALVARPDFRAFADGQWIFVMNGGDADYTGPLDVKATCTREAKPAPDACGPNFPGGTFFYHLAAFPAGHGPSVAPVKGSDNAQQVTGYGWRALRMDLPAGATYQITVTVDPNGKIAEKDEANNTAPPKSITIAPASGPSTIQVKPGAIQLAPTAPPARKP